MQYNEDKETSTNEVRTEYEKIKKKNPGRGEIFRTSLYRPWGPHSLLYKEYRVSFPGVKRPRRGVNHPLPSVSRLKKE
jgi:hypothetical protein